MPNLIDIRKDFAYNSSHNLSVDSGNANRLVERVLEYKNDISNEMPSSQDASSSQLSSSDSQSNDVQSSALSCPLSDTPPSNRISQWEPELGGSSGGESCSLCTHSFIEMVNKQGEKKMLDNTVKVSDQSLPTKTCKHFALELTAHEKSLSQRTPLSFALIKTNSSPEPINTPNSVHRSD